MRNKIIHFIVGDINVTGGVEKVTNILSNEFVNRGAKVIIHSLYSSDNQSSKRSGLEVINLGLVPPDRETNLFSKIKRLILNGLILRKSISTSRASHNFIFQGFYLATLLPFFQGIRGQKIVCEHNTYGAPSKLSRIARFVIYKLFSPRLVVLTEADQKQFMKLGITDTRKIYNPLPAVTKPADFNSKNKTLISLGRFTSQKRFDLMIATIAPVLKEYPEWRLKIQGGGEDFDSIKFAAAKSGVHNQIELIPQGDPTALYEEGSIFLMTSLFEGLPMTLIESMSHGIPVVSYGCSPGLSEVVENEVNGFLVGMNDSKSFIDKVSKLMDDSMLRKRLGANALKSVEKYQLSTVIADWEKLIQ